MTAVADFEKLLKQNSRPRAGTWRRVDLHNHTPASFDYKGGSSDVVERTARQILDNDLSVVLFTDHSCLPDVSFVNALHEKTKRLILRGVELNVFVDAWDKPGAKVDKNLYFHLLIGFDPENTHPPDYWLERVYHECNAEKRDLGGTMVKGVSSSLDQVWEALRDSNAILIPAHLHSTRDAFKSRSIDDIYADPEFLRHAREHFTALEVTSSTTAAFFDGTHEETGKLQKSCVQSSDSHEPSKLGWRHSYVQMEEVTFAELKAGLELPFRTSLQHPAVPSSYIAGIHIDGQFLRDLWVTFSPHCNVFMGVKGSGKTSVLECLRFVLGADVPTSRREEVESHLNAILGPGGKVTALIKRDDGAKLLVQRSLADRAFVVTFADGRKEILQRAESLLFPAYILGWHEIEHAATDVNIRRLYMDGIAGRAKVRELEEQAEILVKQIREKHDHAGSRYSLFKGLHQQVVRLEELRKGLRTLEDANLIELRNQYQSATDDREALRISLERLRKARESAQTHTDSFLTGIAFQPTGAASPLSDVVASGLDALQRLRTDVSEIGRQLAVRGGVSVQEMEALVAQAEAAYQTFRTEYASKVDVLTPEQRHLLESHRLVMEETKELARLEAERAAVKLESENMLRELVDLCTSVATTLDAKSNLRSERVAEFNKELLPHGVHLATALVPKATDFQELSQRYGSGAKILNELRSNFPGRLSHLCVGQAYGSLLGGLEGGSGSIFSHSEISYFLDIFEDDDLRIALKVGNAGEEFSPIDQLSAGQRCTAIFPLLLKLERGPLIIDQPEDNLDNRHIATMIAPVLLRDKQTRQMMFTSHNANLVVLSDAEVIFSFESDGAQGKVEQYGFLAMRESRITQHVIDILDGGERALHLRTRKYGTRESDAQRSG